MIEQDKETQIHSIGNRLAEVLAGFFGKVVFNLKDGRYVNANIEQSIVPDKNQTKPERQEKKR